MKIFGRIFIAVVLIILVIIIFIVSAIFVDSNKTSYLKISQNPEFQENSYLIKNVNILTMTSDSVLRDQMILLRDGIIVQIAKEIAVSGMTIIDGKDGYLMPGLIDMHVHVWDEYELGLYLANGVTTVRNLWGQPMHLRMKKSIHQEDIIGPVFFTSSPKLTGPVFIGDDNLQLFSPEQARTKIREYKERGYDFIKTYNGLTVDLYDAVLQEARAQELDIVAHPSSEVQYSYHFKPEIVTIEHAEDIVQQPLNYKLDTAGLNAVVDLFASNPDATLCPTLAVYYNIYRLITEDRILDSKELKYINPLIRKVDSKAQFDRWAQTKVNDPDIGIKIKDQHEFHLFAINKLYGKGVNIVAGTDAGIGVTPAGYAIYQELDFYRQAGMSNYEALKTATINPSKTHDSFKNMGSIEPGKMANLILVNENPLITFETLKEPELLFIRGRKIPKLTLKEFESRAANRTNLIVSVLRYLEYLMVEK